MQRIEPARLKPGVAIDALPSPSPDKTPEGRASLIRGNALIFWDLKVPGHKNKLDAIDTDQITPASSSQ